MKGKFKSKRTAGIVAIERKKRELDERRTALEGLHVTQRQIIGSQSDRIETLTIELNDVREQRDNWLTRWQDLKVVFEDLEVYFKRLEGEKAELSAELEDCQQELIKAEALYKDTYYDLLHMTDSSQLFKQRTADLSRQLSKVCRDLDRTKTRAIICTFWAAGGWLLALSYFGAYVGLWG